MLRLKEVRKHLNLKQKEVCTILGIAPNTFSQYENGKREPDYETLEKIADYFDVSIDYLFGRIDKPSPDNEKLSILDFALYDEIKDLSDIEKEKILEFIKFTKMQRK